MKKTVAVLKGGWSAERDVSLTSGHSCATALRARGYQVREIDVTRDIPALIAALTPLPDVVFNALHGKGGEDGCIQGVLDILGVPYTHSGLATSALAMNKHRAKQILQPYGMPCAAGALVAIEDIRAGRVPIEPPYVIKPNSEGSSVGVYIVRDAQEPIPQLNDWAFGDLALVEAYVPGRELSVAVMGTASVPPKALAVTEIIANADFYNYEAKYAAGGSFHVVPAGIDPAIYEQALRLAELAHETLGCMGVSRSDFRYNDRADAEMGLVYLETNTQPGMTPTSLVPEQAAHIGMDFGELVDWMVQNASCHAE